MQFIQKWNSDVYNSPKYINYRIFKTNFKPETYFTEFQLKFYISIARFRTRNHRPPIERGQWENIERSQRFCTLCYGNGPVTSSITCLNVCVCVFFFFFFSKDSRKAYQRQCNTLNFYKLMTVRNVKLLRLYYLF